MKKRNFDISVLHRLGRVDFSPIEDDISNVELMNILRELSKEIYDRTQDDGNYEIEVTIKKVD